MLAIPEMTRADVAFGNIKHLPRRKDLPEEFQNDWFDQPYCRAVSSWFFKGAKREGDKIMIGDTVLRAKPGVDASKALAAIGAALGSFEPSHEHKIGGCGYLLSQWFDII